MDQYILQAYESLGAWHITVTRRWIGDDGENRSGLIYRGDHVPIDEEDPQVRAVLLLSQVTYDLSDAIRDGTDMLADRAIWH